MSPVATTQFPPSKTTTREYAPGIAVGLMTLVVVVLFFLPALGTAAHVDEVTFDNPNADQVGVEVTTGRLDGWVGIGPIDAEESEVVREVFDAGDTWVFRFTAPEQEPVKVSVDRHDLEAADWNVQIPDLSG